MIRRLSLILLSLATAATINCSSAAEAEDSELEEALAWLDDGCEPTSLDQRCDQGLYWFGKGNESSKWRPKAASRFYDPKKPTLIYVHGWQPDSVAKKARETFDYKKNDPETGVDVITSDAWIDAGWNVGIFYWNRLADDPGLALLGSPDAAEAKISRVDGPTGMRWRKNDGSYETKDVPRLSASDLFYRTYVAALHDYVGPHVRIAGHSLGNQMAVRMVDAVSHGVQKGTVSRALMPKRLAILDPYWTKRKANDGAHAHASPAREVRDAVYLLARNGVAIEQYRSSSINDLGLGDDNPFVEQNAAYVELYPRFGGTLNSLLPWKFLRTDHRAAPNLYFWSFAFAPPSRCGDGAKRGEGLSAAATDATVREWMGPARYWVQEGGRETATPADDCMIEKHDALPATFPIAMTWKRRTEGGGLDVSVEVPAHTAFVRYFVGGHRVGFVSRDDSPDGRFATVLRDLPSGEGAIEQLVVASAFDRADQLIGTTENMADLSSGVGMRIRQLARMTFEVSLEAAPSGVASLELDVDGSAVLDTTSTQRRVTGNAVIATYPAKDGQPRAFVLRGYDAAGAELMRLERHFILR